MNQTLHIQQLATRLAHIEAEVNVIREELAQLRGYVQPTSATATSHVGIAFPWANKAAQRQHVGALFTALSIQGAPMGIQALQCRMSQAGLAQDELSRSLVEAREE